MAKLKVIILFFITLSFMTISCGRYSKKGDDVDVGAVTDTSKTYKWVNFSTIKSIDPGEKDFFAGEYDSELPYEYDYIQLTDKLLVCSSVGEDNDATGIFHTPPSSYNNNCEDAGALYVFRKFGPGWKFEAYIKAPVVNYPKKHGDYSFGESFSLEGNLIVVNAHTGEDVVDSTGMVRPKEGLFLCIRDDEKKWHYQREPILTTDDVPAIEWWDGELYNRDGYNFGKIMLKGNKIFCATQQRVLIYKLLNEDGVYRAELYEAIENPNMALIQYKKDDLWYGKDFGYYMSASGNTLAVSSPDDQSGHRGVVLGGNFEEDHSGYKHGAVYVYKDSGDGYELEACIYRPLDGSKSKFSKIYRVALEGDLLAMTCKLRKLKDKKPHDVVLIYRRFGSTWQFEKMLEAHKGTNQDYTISSLYNVKISNGKIAVSAPYDSVKCLRILQGSEEPPKGGRYERSGAIYVFSRNESGAWEQEAYIKSFQDKGRELVLGLHFAFANDVIATSINIDWNFSGVINSTELPPPGSPLKKSGAIQTIHYK